MPKKELKPELTPNALTVLEKRYLQKDAAGKVVETPAELFQRVADSVAKVERSERKKWADLFYEMMARRRFIPNSPTLMNAGKDHGQLSACFVLPVDDSLEGIFDTLKAAAKIHQSGGGTGFAFSDLRPKGSLVKTTHGAASGPLSFIRIYDTATETIKQGGARRGANMAILRVDHPDILEFVDSKRDHKSILNFNISVGVTDEFMRAVISKADFALRDPRSGKPVQSLPATKIFDAIIRAAWECGDPGLVFLDRINAFNPTPLVGEMESTNPCVTAESRIYVEGKGLVPIAELVGARPLISTEEDARRVLRSVTQVVCTGSRPVYRLTTWEGYQLRLTADHRVATENGDVPAEELQPGDRIRLMEVESSAIDRDSRDARIGEVIGWLTGDGHFTHHEAGKPTVVLSFYGMDKKEAGNRILSTVREFLNDPALSMGLVEQRDLGYIRSQRLLTSLREFGVTETCKKGVPERVWRGSHELIAGYLRGFLSADGSVQGSIAKGVSVRLANNELELLRQVQLLLLHLGIKSVLYVNRRAPMKRLLPDSKRVLREYECSAQHELVISRASLLAYEKSVGFLIAEKSQKLQGALGNYRRGPYRESFFATVEGLYYEGEEEVFDLTEPSSHHFHANGILVHNCGEQPLLPYESCNLGSLNLGTYYDGKGFDWELYRDDIHNAVRFLDNVIDLNTYPVDECGQITRRNRKIGLGVMGFADLLLMLGIPYGTEEARGWGEKLMSFLDRDAKHASAELARKRGAFPNWKGSLWQRLGYPPLRNATVSTVAPTGTISIIAGASSGIEPIFAGIFYRNVLSGARLEEVHPALEKALRTKGIGTQGITEEKISQILGSAWSPAQRVPVEDHVKMQAVFQRHSDSAVSKTINLPESAKTSDIAQAYLLAYEMGCKGITVYRDRSRPTQVLETEDEGRVEVPAGDVEACPTC